MKEQISKTSTPLFMESVYGTEFRLTAIILPVFMGVAGGRTESVVDDWHFSCRWL